MYQNHWQNHPQDAKDPLPMYQCLVLQNAIRGPRSMFRQFRVLVVRGTNTMSGWWFLCCGWSVHCGKIDTEQQNNSVTLCRVSEFTLRINICTSGQADISWNTTFNSYMDVVSIIYCIYFTFEWFTWLLGSFLRWLLGLVKFLPFLQSSLTMNRWTITIAKWSAGQSYGPPQGFRTLIH